MKGVRPMSWYWFFTSVAVSLIVAFLVAAVLAPETPSEIAKFIERDVMPLWNHGRDPQWKVPPLVREDKQTGTLVRVREK
jgi:hypothetical protein